MTGAAEAGAVEEVVALELALLTPEVRRSRARLEELLDPEFSEIGASGRLWGREAVIEMLVGDEDRDRDQASRTPLPTAEMAGRPAAPGLILLTYVSDPGGRAARRSSLWRRSGGSWRVLFHQGTLLPVVSPAG